MRKNILVSVICLTYNHCRYISQTLESILAQDCDFELEIIVHDDASTDGTIEVIKSYAEKFSQIRPMFREVNLYQKGYQFWNDIIQLCNGNYIAFCEGDDYWIDNLKLQKQISFLENNKEYVLHVFDSYIEENGIIQNIGKLEYLNIKKGEYDKNKLKDHFILMPLTSCVRNNKDLNYPLFFSKSINGDYKLQLKLSMNGKAFVDDSEKVAVYRKLDSGIWSKKSIDYKFYEQSHTLLVASQFYSDNYHETSNEKLFSLFFKIFRRIGFRGFLSVFVKKINRMIF
ncbi:glycosyltransferase family 2 protein [Photobacterium leiognathi]|uniref:glycosyltransferase family 2 protein n=1 Tax=Photobacterium leiognathi TaxID=553611 RepID=UPI0029810831|nr:glycosyltransferase [Photobacterium leiognathi]